MLRETATPGAVLTRVAASHIRVGTFQYFAARGDTEAISTLADYAIARHYPEILDAEASAKRPYRALLDGVISRQARLVAQWMLFGFIHGADGIGIGSSPEVCVGYLAVAGLLFFCSRYAAFNPIAGEVHGVAQEAD